MHTSPLSWRVIVLSLAGSLAVWPAVWCLLACAQGLGTVVAGGSFIGISVPLGSQPWALVNEPTGAFAGSRMALVAYWLAPTLLALVLAFGMPLLSPSPAAWWGELVVFHCATAAALLGLAFLPSLGLGDGPARGLATFWRVRPVVFIPVLAGFSALGAIVAWTRLAGYLWAAPGGPTVRRRILVTLVHGGVPSMIWLVTAAAVGWGVLLPAVASVAAASLTVLMVAWRRVPHSALHRLAEPTNRQMTAAAICGIVVFTAAALAGSPVGSLARGYVWKRPGVTNNVRATIAVFPILGGATAAGRRGQ